MPRPPNAPNDEPHDDRRPKDDASRRRKRARVAAASDPVVVYDAGLRLALTLIESGAWDLLAGHMGLDWRDGKKAYLGLFIDVDRAAIRRKGTRRLDVDVLSRLELQVASAVADEFASNPAFATLPVQLSLMPGDPARTASGTLVADALANMVKSGFILRIGMSVPHGLNLHDSLDALELPAPSAINPQPLTGRDIVIGIIDDGCAFAHADFLDIAGTLAKRTYRTRVLALWDQSRQGTAAELAAGWRDVPDFLNRGRELRKPEIDAMLAKHTRRRALDEDAVYEELGYDVGGSDQRAAHGTRVMGIAAGNGNSLMGWRGVAPKAHIIFVQLPPSVRESPDGLSLDIALGAMFVFKRAAELNAKAAVLNLSLGSFTGPHDGTNPWEQTFDQLLNVRDRAIVISAGNGFEANCHAMGTIVGNGERTLGWNVWTEDPSPKRMDIWYSGQARLALTLVAPDGTTHGPFEAPGRQPVPGPAGQPPMGVVMYALDDAVNGDNSMLIGLAPTAASAQTAHTSAAPAGTWKVRLANGGETPADFHAWIQRDDLGKSPLRRQSSFVDADAHPAFTFGDLAGGKLTIAVGGYNIATSEVCAYSACGPTRASMNDAAQRTKPEVLAPAEELALGGGVSSSGSRQSQPGRIAGTSAAAPHVAGIAALAFEYRRRYQKQHLTAAELQAALQPRGGQPLLPNRREALHPYRALHQKDVWNDLIGVGKISASATLDKL
jgi:subtilisin family serine protease